MSAVRERERRSTAGKRLTFLAGQELENDQAFWGHDTWQEDSESYQSADGSLAVDEFDSDFDESESDHDTDADDALGAAEERKLRLEEQQNTAQSKKRNVAAYTDTKKASVVGAVGSKAAVVLKKGRWNRGKRIMGDGLNTGIVLNIPLSYQQQQQKLLPAAATTTTSAAGASVSWADAPPPPETSSTHVPVVATTAVDSTSVHALATTSAAVAVAAPKIPVAAVVLKRTSPPRQKLLGPTLAASRVRRGRVRTSTSIETNTTNKLKIKSVTATSPKATATAGANQMKKGKRSFTQEEMLLEAVQETEPENERWLLGRKRSQAVKDDNESASRNYDNHRRGGKVIEKFVSRRGYLNTITFPDMDHIPDLLRTSHHSATTASTPPPPVHCVVTGKVAKYRDPITGMGYYDMAAFKELRRRHAANESLSEPPTIVGAVGLPPATTIAAAACHGDNPSKKAIMTQSDGSLLSAKVELISATSTATKIPLNTKPMQTKPKSVSKSVTPIKREPATSPNGEPANKSVKSSIVGTNGIDTKSTSVPGNVGLDLETTQRLIPVEDSSATALVDQADNVDTKNMLAKSTIQVAPPPSLPFAGSQNNEAVVPRISAVTEVEVHRKESIDASSWGTPSSPGRRSPRKRKPTAKALENSLMEFSKSGSPRMPPREPAEDPPRLALVTNDTVGALVASPLATEKK